MIATGGLWTTGKVATESRAAKWCFTLSNAAFSNSIEVLALGHVGPATLTLIASVPADLLAPPRLIYDQG
jgi:hypothetical protein